VHLALTSFACGCIFQNQLGTAAYAIILSFTVSLTLHYSLKPPPSLSLSVQMEVTLSNEQPVEAEWLWTHCEEYKITR